MENWLAATAAGVLAVFGAHGGVQGPNHDMKSSSTPRGEVKERQFKTSSSTMAKVDITCVAAAVSAREASLATAQTTYTSGVNAAYAARATALASAYAQTENAAIKTAVKTAWKSFSDSVKGTKGAWQKAKESSWKTFRTAVKACGGGAESVSDVNNSGSEISGQ